MDARFTSTSSHPPDIEKTPAESRPAAFHAPDFPEGGKRAWLVVLGALIVNGCSFGYTSSFGVYQTYYQSHQLSDKSPSGIAWIGSIQICFQFGAGLAAGSLFDRYGARVIIIPASIVYIFSIMMTSLCTSYYQFILAQGVLGGLSNGFLFTPAFSAVSHYFRAKRGAALGLVAVGSAAGGVIIPIVLESAFYGRLGFGWGVRCLGFGILALQIVACVLIKARLPPHRGAFFAPDAVKSPAYVLVVLGMFFVMWGVFAPFFFLSEYAIEKLHMSHTLAFYLLSILNGVSFFGRAFFGAMSDKLGLMNLLCIVSVINGVLVFCWTSTTTNAGLIVWTAVYGFFSGSIFALFPAAFAQVTPKPQLIGTYMGQAMAVLALSGLTGSPITGQLVAKYGFEEARIFAGLSLIVGGAFIAVARFFHQPKLMAIA